MSKIEKAVQWMEATAADDSHGYSNKDRWGPDNYDCSSFVIQGYEQAGVPVKTKGATYTGNMKKVFLACGFKDVTNSVNKSTGEGMIRGDVLLNTLFHTAVYTGNGNLVHARSDDGHSETGDQNGKEIRVQKYFNYPWNYVLRYQETGETAADAQTCSDDACEITPKEELPAYWPPRQLKKGMKGGDVKVLQAVLLARGYDCGDIDGDFGNKTNNMVMAFQGESSLEIDGIAGKNTWKALVTM